ncbi:MAG: hypothetical protein VX640_04245 [Pseudomonadota bacterium]|nr:hypothetical protein [Pseudomonadota bacterium]
MTLNGISIILIVGFAAVFVAVVLGLVLTRWRRPADELDERANRLLELVGSPQLERLIAKNLVAEAALYGEIYRQADRIESLVNNGDKQAFISYLAAHGIGKTDEERLGLFKKIALFFGEHKQTLVDKLLSVVNSVVGSMVGAKAK